MKKSKATALLFYLAAIKYCSALRCYQCIYIKEVCGDDCKDRPDDSYLSADINDTLPRLVTSSACNLSHAHSLGLSKQDAETLTTSLSMSTSMPEPIPKWYVYCQEQFLQSQFINAVVRGYTWDTSPDLDGNMTEDSKGSIISVETYYCKTDGCNGAHAPGHGHEIFILSIFFLFHVILFKNA